MFDADKWSDEPNDPNHSAYLQVCDSAYADLKLVRGDPEFPSDGVTVICVARNEADRLPSFLAHYQRLGARRIHVIDNASSDETCAIACSWPDTTVWYTDASFAEASAGQTWRCAVVRRHGLGNWVLSVDVDEHLVYDGMDRYNLTALCAWLQSRGSTRLFAPMIDVYSKLPIPEIENGWITKLWTIASGSFRNNSPFDNTFYFDCWGPAASPNYRFHKTSMGVNFEGGVRERVVGNHEWCLSKTPLSLWDRHTAYAIVHFPYPFRLNPDQHYGALLHYKFVGNFRKRVASAVREKQYWRESYEYTIYQKWLDQQPSLFDQRYSVPYRSPGSLVSEGLLLPIDWTSTCVLRRSLDPGTAASKP